ncbi:MAG: c-type cytochrome [Methylobacter sp.]
MMRIVILSLTLAISFLVAPDALAKRHHKPAGRHSKPDVVTANQLSYNQVGEPQVPAQIKLIAYDRLYANDNKAIFEGSKLFVSMNCVACHGAVGSGGALAGRAWFYGDSPEQLFLSILQGRPNGMPAFGDLLPEDSIWKLVAYIKSLNLVSGQSSE